MDKYSFKKIAYISLALHVVAAIFSTGFHHFDEYFQIYEFLNFKLGETPAENLTWEYHRKIRPWFQVFNYYIIYKGFGLIGITSPFKIAFIFRLLTSIFGWYALIKMLPLIKDWFQSERFQKLAFILFNFAWFVPYIQTRTSSESFGISFFLLGLVHFLRSTKDSSKKFDPLYAGLLFGFSYLSRSQMSFMVAFLWFWGIFIQKMPWKKLLATSLGIILVIALGVLFDYWGYESWVFSTWYYFKTNFMEGILSNVQQYPWYWYIRLAFNRGMPPVSLVLLLATFFGWYKFWRHPLTWATLPLFIFHSYVGHKELRYIFPIIILSPIYLALILEKYQDKFQSLWEKKPIRGFVKFTIFVNIFFLIISSLRPANPSVNFYKFVYDYHPKINHFYAIGESPYTMLGANLLFYKRKGIKIDVVKKYEDIVWDKPFIVFFNRGHHIFKMEKNPNCKNIYMAYPRWSLNFNIGNWLSRSRVWSLYQCFPQKN